VSSTPPCVPETGRAAPLPPAERRASVIRAVLPLLVERGAAVTTRELAASAEVSEGTLFKVFDDKDELIRAAVAVATDPEPFERAVSAIDPALPFEQRLVAATGLIQRRIVDIWQLISKLDARRHQEPTHQPLPDSAALTALLASGGDRVTQPPAEAARLLRGLTLALTHPLFTPRPRSADDIVDVFLNGVGA
jgi:AcrR family transcriptional regulator